MKLKKATLLKTIVALLVPGGFIVWGAYELGKRVGNKKRE